MIKRSHSHFSLFYLLFKTCHLQIEVLEDSSESDLKLYFIGHDNKFWYWIAQLKCGLIRY